MRIRHIFRKFHIILFVLILSLLSTGCTRSLHSDNYAVNDVDLVLKITKCKTEVNKLGSTIFNTDFQLTNNGNKEITSVTFETGILDGKGNTLYTFKDTFYINNQPLKNGDSITFSRGFQRVLNDKASKLDIRILNYTTPEERPAVHIPQTGELLADIINDYYVSNMKDNPPTEIEIIIDHMGDQQIAKITDTETINEIINAFNSVKIGTDSGEFVTDNYNGISFTFDNGHSKYVGFTLKNYEFNDGNKYYSFSLDNFEPLWSLMNSLTEKNN